MLLPSAGDVLLEGLAQLDGYLSRLDLDSGTLLIFDRRPSAVKRPPGPQVRSGGPALRARRDATARLTCSRPPGPLEADCGRP